MKIICTTPLGHLNGLKDLLKDYGKLYYFPNIQSDELKQKLKRFKIEAIFCNPNRQGYVLDQNILNDSYVRYINTASTGTNHINLEDCKRLKIKIFSLKDDKKIINSLPSTSELAFGLMINLLKNIKKSSKSVENFKWDYLPFIGRELASLTVGIIGYGRLGKIMERYCKSFGMKVFISDPYKGLNKKNNITIKKMFEISDVISLHVHVNQSTKYLISDKYLKLAKKKPIIVNTSRGEIVVEKDIINHIKMNKISGYGTDVVEDEFGDVKKSPIIDGARKGLNILITPHLGGMTKEGQLRAWTWAINKFNSIGKSHV